MENQHNSLPSLTGKKIGKWSVGEETKKTVKGGPRLYRCYVCTCECGSVSEIRTEYLASGRAVQCKKCADKNRVLQKTCRKGHEIAVHGRTKGGACKACSKGTQLMRDYGITLEEYETLYYFQEGKCAICGKKLALVKHIESGAIKGRAEVDHLHILKKQKVKPPKKDTVRGLLCGGRWAGCNHKLGRVDKIEWLRAALVYLENPPARQLFGKAEPVVKSKKNKEKKA